jgi:hypothetical protein
MPRRTAASKRTDERFVVGKYVSINERGKMHACRVTSMSYL